jgi:SAM-dependent methyltransferase
VSPLQEVAQRVHRSGYPKAAAFPPVLLQGKKVLDLGCGHNALAVEGSFAFGVDAFASPRKELAGRLNFVRGRMERLPFADQSFDFVSSRNAMQYSHMPTTLAEIRRILKTGGMLWGTVIGLREAFARLASSALLFKARDMAFVAYGLANGVLAAGTGKQLRLGGRCETVNTKASVQRLLRDAGFEVSFVAAEDNRIVFAAIKS